LPFGLASTGTPSFAFYLTLALLSFFANFARSFLDNFYSSPSAATGLPPFLSAFDSAPLPF